MSAFLALLMWGMGGCAELSAPGLEPVEEDWSGLRLTLLLDPEMTVTDQSLLRDDIAALRDMEFSVSEETLFQKIFSGTTQLDVIRYIDERINFIVPDTQDLRSRLASSRFLHDSQENNGPMVMASNIGTALWLERVAGNPDVSRFRIGEQQLEITSPRVGLIMLGEGYSYRFDTLDRVGTLVHEARHSDCTGGLSDRDRALLRRNQLPANRACGHLHVECPITHEYGGIPACDAHPWGAYAVQAVFFSAVARECLGCDEEELQLAMLVGADSASRVLILDELLSGLHGFPDMSSVNAD